MELVLGHKVDEKHKASALNSVGSFLIPEERVRAIFRPTNIALTYVYVTDYRLIALFASPTQVVWLSDPFRVKPAGKSLELRPATGKPFALKLSTKDDVSLLENALGEARAEVDVTKLATARGMPTRADAIAAITPTPEHKKTAEERWPGAVIVGGKVSPKAQRAIERMSEHGEAPWFVLTTSVAGVLVAWDDRLAIVKTGGMTALGAGAMGGERSATFYFAEVTGIEYNSGLVNGVLEVLTPSYSGTANKDYWRGMNASRNADSGDPFTLSNTLPLNKMDYDSASPQLNELRRRIAESKRAQVTVVQAAPAPQPAPTSSPSDLAAGIKQLADLHAAGALTDDEFAAGKRRLLEG